MSLSLLVLSDLHVEFAPFVPDAAALAGVDVVVLAGDIHQGARGIEWARRAFANLPVIYVAGNHEFYGHHWMRLLDELRSQARRWDVHFLENDAVRLGGVRFLGCTLWSDFEYFGVQSRPAAMRDAASRMNDFRMIHADPLPGVYWAGRKHRLSPWHVLRRHRQSLDWLQGELAPQCDGPTVVVTHHYPSPRSTTDAFKDDLLTAAYGSDLPQALISQSNLWIHGHTHSSHDYTVQTDFGSARVLCNPRGYPLRRGFGQFENGGFVAGLKVCV